MKKIAIYGVILVVLIIGIILFLSSQPKIVLAEINGEVLVNGQTAEVGMVLKESDKIVTAEGSSAEVSLYEGSVLRIGESSELDLSTVKRDEIGVNQLSGRTWSRIVKLSGIKNYFVKTPDAVATVRGTAFDVKLVDGQTYISSADGVVEVDNGVERREVVKDSAILVSERRLMRATVKLDSWRTGNLDKDNEHLRKVKQKLKEKYGDLIERAKGNYNITEDDVERGLEGYIDGRLKIRDLISKEKLRELREEKREERMAERFEDELNETDVDEKNAVDVGVVEEEVVGNIEEPVMEKSVEERSREPVKEELNKVR